MTKRSARPVHLLVDEAGNFVTDGLADLDSLLAASVQAIHEFTQHVRAACTLTPARGFSTKGAVKSVRILWQDYQQFCMAVPLIAGQRVIKWDPLPAGTEGLHLREGHLPTGRGITTFPAVIADLLRQAMLAVLANHLDDGVIPGEAIEHLERIATGLQYHIGPSEAAGDSKSGDQKRPRSGGRRPSIEYVKMAIAEAARAQSLRNDGLSYRAIAAEMRVSYRQARNLCKGMPAATSVAHTSKDHCEFDPDPEDREEGQAARKSRSHDDG